MALSDIQRERYLRHLILPQIGEEGQERLLAAKVLLIGAGGLGSPAALYLAAAGVGTLGIIDSDVVEMSNLQRQVLHSTDTVGLPKIESARQRIAGINPDVRMVGHEARLTSANAMEVLDGYDFVIDGSDNFPTRYLSNDACVMLGKPNIYGAIYQFEGQASVFFPPHGPCYRCLFPEPPPPGMVPTCAEAGVLGVLPGVIGMIQATEAIKLILGRGETLTGRLLLYDAMRMSFRELKLRRNQDCPVCGENPTITRLIDYEMFCNGGNRHAPALAEIGVAELRGRMERGDDFVLVDCRNPDEYELGHIDGSLLMPLPSFEQHLSGIEPHRNRTIIVYCQVGIRSAAACRILNQAGFEHPVNVRGGFGNWISSGFPVAR